MWFFNSNKTPSGVTGVSFHLTFAGQELCYLLEVCVVQLDWESSNISGSYESTSFWHPLWFGESLVQGWKRACPSGHKSAGKASLYLQRMGFPPWFTAPTEMKLGTATVSAPGPLSSSQDELFAEDIQMYKEQIRLTQSSFTWREKKRKRTDWLQKDLFPPASWMSERVWEWKQPCVFKVLIHNLFL